MRVTDCFVFNKGPIQGHLLNISSMNVIGMFNIHIHLSVKPTCWVFTYIAGKMFLLSIKTLVGESVHYNVNTIK